MLNRTERDGADLFAFQLMRADGDSKAAQPKTSTCPAGPNVHLQFISVPPLSVLLQRCGGTVLGTEGYVPSVLSGLTKLVDKTALTTGTI